MSIFKSRDLSKWHITIDTRSQEYFSEVDPILTSENANYKGLIYSMFQLIYPPLSNENEV